MFNLKKGKNMILTFDRLFDEVLNSSDGGAVFIDDDEEEDAI